MGVGPSMGGRSTSTNQHMATGTSPTAGAALKLGHLPGPFESAIHLLPGDRREVVAIRTETFRDSFPAASQMPQTPGMSSSTPQD